MALFSIESFRGMDRLSAAQSRGSGTARVVGNASLLGGVLSPLTSQSLEGSAETIGAIHDNSRFLDRWWDGLSHYWTSWPGYGRPVDFVSGLLPDDQFGRGYWTGAEADGRPRMASSAAAIGGGGSIVTVPLQHFLLGVPRIAQAPTFNSQIAPDDEEDTDTLIHVAWVHTLVTDFGEEGPPSLPSNALRINDGQAVELTLPTVSAALRMNRALTSFGGRRLYRGTTGGTTTTFQFVKEIGLDEDMVVDDVETQRLQEPLPSTHWSEPPDNLLGLIALPEGVLAGYANDTLWFSESYLPHAWPPAYRKALDVPVVRLGLSSQGLIVLTEGRPYLVTGSDPRSLSVAQVPFPQGCINERSVVDMGDGLYYAAPDGLARIDNQRAEIVTENLLSPREWRTRYDVENYLGFRWEGRYVGILDADSMPSESVTGFVFDPKRGLSDLDWQATGGYSNPQDGSLRLLGLTR